MSDGSPQDLRAQAIEALLVENGLLDPRAIDDVIVKYNERVGPMNGAAVVAKAWTDPQFKQALLDDGTRAIADFRFEGGEVEKLVVVENSADVHNVVVCTLCSCYPWALLGLPPRWYKDPAYRSRVVREPRAVLRSSAPSCRLRNRSTFGIRAPRFATWYCRNARPGRKAGTRRVSNPSSPETP